jgi:multidrug efflux pump subunit AcrB
LERIDPSLDPSLDPNKGIISWFARNHIAANLMMFVIILTGFFSASTIRTQIIPDVQLDVISIDVAFPGAAPGEVESGVVTRIEEAVRDIEGIADMRSFSNPSSGRVRLDVETSYEALAIMDEVKMAVDRISNFPESIEKPVIYRSQPQPRAINVQIFGDLDETTMKDLASTIQDEILSLPSVTKADIQGARPYEISIELEESRLRQYGLDLNDVAQAVRRSSLDLPAGSIRSDSGDILLRTEGQAYRKADFEKIVLISEMDGTRLTLGDIAIVTDGFAEVRFYSMFNGKPSIGISIYAVGDQNQIDISNEVTDYVEKRSQTLPQGISIESWGNSTAFLSEAINIMVSNMVMGVLLVLLVLGIFLRLQLAFWVMLGMPIAFLGAFAVLPLVDGSLNLLSLFGFILVLGIVVDDAIIIGESVQTASDREGHSLDTVIRGAKRVAMPATFGVLTTVVTFIPLLTVEGGFGAMPAAIGSVVILCLLFSILESKLILPAHLASMKPLPANDDSPLRRFQSRFSVGLKNFVEQKYRPLLVKSIKARYTTLSVFIGMLILAVGFVMGPYVKTVFFPNMSSDFIMAQLEMVDGTSPAQVVKVVERLNNSLLELDDEQADDDKFLKNMAAYVFSNSGNVVAELKSIDSLSQTPEQIATNWRKRVGEISGVKTIQITGAQKSHGYDKDVNFKLVSPNIEELEAAAELLHQHLRSYDGVYDIENSNTGSIPEINLKIKPSAEALGLALTDLASQVRSAFYGVEAQRLQRGREEVKVMVRYPRDERESLGNLESMYIRTADGDEVPFSAVADLETRLSPSTIRRSWGKRTIVISADINRSITQPGKIVTDVTAGDFSKQLAQLHPGVRIELGGASQEEEELVQRMILAFALALFGIYALMAIPLKSYGQPLIIMGVIPFGMIGALIGHIVVGIPFSALSVYGIVALAGVVVNDSIILVDFVNKSVAAGMDIVEAAIKAGTERFRAIMLTSLTTFFGLLPILTETSLSAQLVIPMAVSLGFGILFATLITLILIPCLYVILNDIKLTQKGLMRGVAGSGAS